MNLLGRYLGLPRTDITATATAEAATGPAVILIDEDSIDNGNPPNLFTPEQVNDDIANVGQRQPLRFFTGANVGLTITLHTGQTGDEGWFGLPTIPETWAAAGPTPNGVENYWMAGPGLGSGSDPESLLDKIPNVSPLDEAGLRSLIGRTACAVVYDSDISVNYNPLNGNLQGANLGVVALKVLSVGDVAGYSSSTLPGVEVEIADPEVTCTSLTTATPRPIRLVK
jgi:hypothetical protein